MSEQTKPEVLAETPDVAPQEQEAVPAATILEEAKEAVVSFADKSLADLSALFQTLMESADRMKRSKEAEAIKSAFYKRLSREKAEAGEDATVVEPTEDSTEDMATVPLQSGPMSPFAAIEAGFKSLYIDYKKERAAYNREQDAQREENLKTKQAIIEELKALVENPGEMKDAFPRFRDIQNRWREAGPVPQQQFRSINDTYQLYVTQFYDLVDINRELRDLDFRKNLESKTEFCEQAEKLAEQANVVDAFKELQKLHEQWKDLGPVAKEYREAIWERFRAATAVINKRYQAHFEELKSEQEQNLAAKQALCEEVEEIASREIGSSAQWNQLSKQIEDIQARWRSIGFATRKENQKIYDRFRAACDKFFERKRASFHEFKDSMNANLEKKMAIIEEAEALSTSTDWNATTERFIELQKQWKEIGAVPRKKSELIWKRFREACDKFFKARDARPGAPSSFAANLAAKREIIAAINAYEPQDAEKDAQAAKDFAEKFAAIGFVPFKEKEAVNKAYRDAMNAKFPRQHSASQGHKGSAERRPVSEKDRLKEQFTHLQQEIQTYENNIGFFGLSKGAEALKAQMQEKIDAAKERLEQIKAKIREAEKQEQSQE
ncbi:MAG: DUF349 domain-containing protein [Bacteroidales bacterium]|nr:DUF349 domain-containing protein [Bacteroidales bacterium]MBP5522377.1 DUF349 domain-containing protein [Bacteroidales bacterium]